MTSFWKKGGARGEGGGPLLTTLLNGPVLDKAIVGSGCIVPAVKSTVAQATGRGIGMWGALSGRTIRGECGERAERLASKQKHANTIP